jgi:hypothetical protein
MTAIALDRSTPSLAASYLWQGSHERARQELLLRLRHLARRKRNAIYAAYAFSGYVDDIADELTTARSRSASSEARACLHACYGGACEGPMFTASAALS